MIVFLDFEASSLTKQSYPIEVAWVFEDGRSQSLLIRPNPDWTDWADEAARIHGITRSQLENEGTDVRDVVAVMMEALSGNQLCELAIMGWQVAERPASWRRRAKACLETEEIRRSLRRSGAGYFEESEHGYRYPGDGCRRCRKDEANRSTAPRSTRCKA